jgi:hypothetical protein
MKGKKQQEDHRKGKCKEELNKGMPSVAVLHFFMRLRLRVKIDADPALAHTLV